MLTDLDTPTIRFAILRRLDKEPGVKVCDLKFARYRQGELYRDVDKGGNAYATAERPFIRVGLIAEIGGAGGLVTKSVFDLPTPFEHKHIINEIDEIAEQYKAAWSQHLGRSLKAGVILGAEHQLKGSGTRGRWASYG